MTSKQIPGRVLSNGRGTLHSVRTLHRDPDTAAHKWSALDYVRRFWSYGTRFLPSLLAGIALRIAEMLADLATPWPIAIVVDSVIGGHPLGGIGAVALGPFSGSPVALLTAAVIASIVLVAVSGLFDYLGDRAMNSAGERITAAIRSDLHAHLQRLPLVYHDRHTVGELVSRMSVDTSNVQAALVALFSTLLPSILSMAGVFLILIFVNWQLGLVAAISAPLIFFTVNRYSRLMRRGARRRRSREGALAGLVAETLSGIRTVQALGRHDLRDQHFGTANQETLAAGLRLVELRARFVPLVELCASLGTGAIIRFGAWGVLHGAWTVGLLIVALTYVQSMLRPIRLLSGLSLTFSRAAAAAERVAAVLDEPLPGAGRGSPAQPPARLTGRIELRGVTFGYDRGHVLNDVSLLVQPGERIALVGANGAGKSSILALLSRLYEPTSGTILLDGYPIEALPLPWLRQQIAVVLQDTFLFSGDLWDNIAYGNPEAGRDEVIRAADQALVTEFVRELPDGFATVLGDRGTGLSGGQQQRVAIARALLRDAPVRSEERRVG